MFKSLANLSKSITSDPDSLIVNRYKLKRFLGKRAMGEVYCAIDRNLSDLNVAIKFLSQSVRDEEIRLRFESEAKISALLGEQSDHIVKVKDYGLNENDIPFYVMELLQGSSLDKIIKKNTLSLKRFLSLKVITFLEKTFNSGDKSFFDQKISTAKKISDKNLLPHSKS